MNSINNLVGIFILWLIMISPFQKDIMYNNLHAPSRYGITKYIEDNNESLIKEYEYKIDTLYDVNLYTDDLGDSPEDNLGEFYPPNDIAITNREKYLCYEYKDLSKFRKMLTSYRERSVKAVVFHELTHVYFHQLTILMKNDSLSVSPEYQILRTVSTYNSQFSADFIEEGTCEYVVYHLKECSPLDKIQIPQTIEDLLDKNNEVNNKYVYSYYFLRDFLDKYGLKKGIQILAHNKPPTVEEILKPELFFNRLK